MADIRGQDMDSLWFRLLQEKCAGADDIFNSTLVGGSQFWDSLHTIKHYFKLGDRYNLSCGSRIHFLLDWWL
jgi:hypothetical protein